MLHHIYKINHFIIIFKSSHYQYVSSVMFCVFMYSCGFAETRILCPPPLIVSTSSSSSIFNRPHPVFGRHRNNQQQPPSCSPPQRPSGPLVLWPPRPLRRLRPVGPPSARQSEGGLLVQRALAVSELSDGGAGRQRSLLSRAAPPSTQPGFAGRELALLPQPSQTQRLHVLGGTLRCVQFLDLNGKLHSHEPPQHRVDQTLLKPMRDM